MELCSADRSEKKTNERRLEPMLWQLAWDAYALAAAALGQVCRMKARCLPCVGVLWLSVIVQVAFRYGHEAQAHCDGLGRDSARKEDDTLVGCAVRRACAVC